MNTLFFIYTREPSPASNTMIHARHASKASRSTIRTHITVENKHHPVACPSQKLIHPAKIYVRQASARIPTYQTQFHQTHQSSRHTTPQSTQLPPANRATLLSSTSSTIPPNSSTILPPLNIINCGSPVTLYRATKSRSLSPSTTTNVRFPYRRDSCSYLGRIQPHGLHQPLVNSATSCFVPTSASNCAVVCISVTGIFETGHRDSPMTDEMKIREGE